MVRIQSKKVIYLDYFSFNFLFFNLKFCLKNEIIIIENLSALNGAFIKILNFLGFNFKELKFVAGHLTYDCENVFLKAREIAGKLAIDCSSDIISSNELILNLSKEFNEGTIELFLSRHLQLNVEKWVSKILVIRSINESRNSDFILFLSKPYIFNEKLLCNYFLNLDLHFYPHNFFRKLKIHRLYIKSIMSTIKFIYYAIKQSSKQSFDEQRSSVLCIQNDTVSMDCKKRRQPHWIEKESDIDYNTYVMSFGYSNCPQIIKEKELNDSNVYVVNPSVFLESYKYHKKNVVLKLILKRIKKINYKIFTSNTYLEKYHLIEINKLFLTSYIISAVALYLKTKVLVINEPQSIHSDALVLVSDKLRIKTIAVQYSNMSMISPLMMSNANVFCIFSEIYTDVFSYRNIKPERFLVTGYLFNGLRDHLIAESMEVREYFENADVDYVITYFDENVQCGKWALYNTSDHIRDIEILSQSVVNNNKLGVILKTQFNKNSPRVLYPNNLLIKQAFDSGRLIEIKSGTLRNDIYAAQAALASDLCIGHAYGATASLEAAVYGIRSVLISENNASTKWDYLYNRNDIVYNSLKSVLDCVIENRMSINSVGDWGMIIDNFDSGRNFSANNNFNEILKNFLN
jgi:hypothetical protein